MNTKNYQKELEKILRTVEGSNPPLLFLHSCCAPCSSYVLKYLRQYFKITVFYYNPNISEQEEYRKRVEEQKKLIGIYNARLAADVPGTQAPETIQEAAPCTAYPIDIVEGDYEPERFFDMARDYKDCPEGGERCFLCYELRLRKTAEKALAGGFDYFGTTLTISPLKNAAKLNEIGEELEKELGVKWLPSDFKKKEGYKQSIELSAEYGLYRQDYCGCVYSKLERETQKRERETEG
ncbi:MAG: epoxyqueuosine reductase QueH [Lachnospiraceae bacterium]|nr:epoxyqueuosine reductase QueH [Lachnospiraceae bacterium]MBQ7780580.1 epoxyqueuosine reductase QueH [Lachnospiraceae bacterium]